MSRRRGGGERSLTSLLMARSASAPSSSSVVGAAKGDILLNMRRLLDAAAMTADTSNPTVTFSGAGEILMLREMLKQFSVQQADAVFAEDLRRMSSQKEATEAEAAAVSYLVRTYSTTPKKADARLLGSVRKAASGILKQRRNSLSPGALAAPQEECTEEDFVEETFREFDADGNGFIDSTEVLQALTRGKPSRRGSAVLTAKDVKTMIESVDDDGDGQINRAEFLELFRASLRATDDNADADFSDPHVVISHSFRVDDTTALRVHPNTVKATALFGQLDNWDFSAFDLAACMTAPLVFVGLAVFGQRDFGAELPLNRSKLVAFLRACDEGYLDVPYHSATHAADVTQTAHYFLKMAGLERHLSRAQVSVLLCTVTLYANIDHSLTRCP